MKSTGIRRKVDDLGRIVIPAGIRRSLNIREGDEVEISVDGERVVLEKPTDLCAFCGSDEGLREFRNKVICRACLAGLATLDEDARTQRTAQPAAAPALSAVEAHDNVTPLPPWDRGTTARPRPAQEERPAQPAPSPPAEPQPQREATRTEREPETLPPPSEPDYPPLRRVEPSPEPPAAW